MHLPREGGAKQLGESVYGWEFHQSFGCVEFWRGRRVLVALTGMHTSSRGNDMNPRNQIMLQCVWGANTRMSLGVSVGHGRQERRVGSSCEVFLLQTMEFELWPVRNGRTQCEPNNEAQSPDSATTCTTPSTQSSPCLLLLGSTLWLTWALWLDNKLGWESVPAGLQGK